MGSGNGKSSSLSDLRKQLSVAQVERNNFETSLLNRNKELVKARTEYAAECDKLESGQRADPSAVLVTIGTLQGRCEALHRKIADVSSRIATLQSSIAEIEAGEQRQRDFLRKQEIAERRDQIRAEIAQVWQAASAKENALSVEADRLAAELQELQAREPRLAVKPAITNPEGPLRVNGRLVSA